MCFYSKKKDLDAVDENRELISRNERQMDALLVLSSGKEEFIKLLKATKEQIKYLTPSAAKKVADYDKKIKDEIEDLKIVLTKCDGEELPMKANTLLKQIKVYIAERNAVL